MSLNTDCGCCSVFDFFPDLGSFMCGEHSCIDRLLPMSLLLRRTNSWENNVTLCTIFWHSAACKSVNCYTMSREWCKNFNHTEWKFYHTGGGYGIWRGGSKWANIIISSGEGVPRRLAFSAHSVSCKLVGCIVYRQALSCWFVSRKYSLSIHGGWVANALACNAGGDGFAPAVFLIFVSRIYIF